MCKVVLETYKSSSLLSPTIKPPYLYINPCCYVYYGYKYDYFGVYMPILQWKDYPKPRVRMNQGKWAVEVSYPASIRHMFGKGKGRSKLLNLCPNPVQTH